MRVSGAAQSRGRTVPDYWIPPHVRACSIADSTILLDLKRNRYFSVGAPVTRALFTLALNWSEAISCAGATEQIEPLEPQTAVRIAEALVKAGLLSVDTPQAAPISCGAVDLRCALASVGYERSQAASPKWRDIVAFLRAFAWARRSLRSKSLYWIASELSRNKGLSQEQAQERLVELVCIFRQICSYTFVTRGRCLLHALALVRFLASYGIFPAWVIGVKSQPWAAHSWVQDGALILDGTPEQVCQYTPILSI